MGIQPAVDGCKRALVLEDRHQVSERLLLTLSQLAELLIKEGDYRQQANHAIIKSAIFDATTKKNLAGNVFCRPIVFFSVIENIFQAKSPHQFGKWETPVLANLGSDVPKIPDLWSHAWSPAKAWRNCSSNFAISSERASYSSSGIVSM